MTGKKLPLAPSLSRREALGALATVAALSTAACTRAPRRKRAPYAEAPPESAPGTSTPFATTLLRRGYGVGVLASSYAGRPIKIEGHPEHPASLGAAGAYEQAAIFDLYDPDRARAIRERATPRSFRSFTDTLASERGDGLHLVLEPTTSPLEAMLLDRVRERLPGVTTWFLGPVDGAARWGGIETAFGKALDPVLDLTTARTFVVLDDDAFLLGPYALRYAHDHFAARRGGGSPARLHVFEATMSATGGSADHRFPVRRSEVGAVVAALLVAVKPDVPPEVRTLAAKAPHRDAIAVIARELGATRGVVHVGDGQPAPVHALVAALNDAIGTRSIRYVDSAIVAAGTRAHDAGAFAAVLRSGAIRRLLALGPDLVHLFPRDRDALRRLGDAGGLVTLAFHEDETADVASWVVPRAHPLESWGDARALDGTLSVVQPLVAPLHGGKTVAEVLAKLGGVAGDGHDLVRRAFETRHGRDAAAWLDAKRRGVVPGSDTHPSGATLAREASESAARTLLAAAEPGPIEIGFPPDRRLGDEGRANDAWLQELPDPVTRLTWGNALELSAKTAASLGVETGDVVEIACGDRRTRAPALLVAGHADGAATLSLGHGKRGALAFGKDVGTNAHEVQTTVGEGFAPAALRKTGDRAELAVTQVHLSQEGRDVARETTVADAKKKGGTMHRESAPATLYDLPPAATNQWGMVIDLGACVGCAACVVACQAENNVPVVGPVAVGKGRAMHWLRIDRYVTGPADKPVVMTQPMLCQHCEHAPCEYVCPVAATTHSPDGLNEMTYNRCVGTRFCSNNCPYKVRRFNWLDWHHDETATEQLAHNPDVTVRERGVMEKCTFCVQRIRRAEIVARREQRAIRDGEVTTACQATCPTGAIVFGSIADEGSAVSAARRDARVYAVLEELGTKPRTLYAARVRNPNPELEG